MAVDASTLLTGIPTGLRDPLLKEYRDLASAFVQAKWKYASLDAGRFCEVVYTIVDGALAGSYPSAPSKPKNFVDSCRDIENRPPAKVGDRSLRILIPRVLLSMYEVRNNRNVGHVGGDVVANHMDAALVYSTAGWVLSELVRIFHSVSTSEAQKVVEVLAERKLPHIWEHGCIRRVLIPGLLASDRVLLLLYDRTDWTSSKSLCDWAKYKNSTEFRSKLLSKLDDEALIEFDRSDDRVMLTPRGVAEVEARILKTTETM